MVLSGQEKHVSSGSKTTKDSITLDNKKVVWTQQQHNSMLELNAVLYPALALTPRGAMEGKASKLVMAF